MLKIFKLIIFSITFAIAWGTAPVLEAQQPKDPPLAPIPRQLLSAKKVFISNASGESAVAQGVPDLTYNEFYEGVKSSGRYELAAAPADADLVFEIRYVLFAGAVHITNGDGGSSGSEQLRVTILDPQTHVVLWAFTEVIPSANRRLTGRKNFDSAMANLVNDIRKLSGQPAPANADAKK
jgi:hypothetical protein